MMAAMLQRASETSNEQLAAFIEQRMTDRMTLDLTLSELRLLCSALTALNATDPDLKAATNDLLGRLESIEDEHDDGTITAGPL